MKRIQILITAFMLALITFFQACQDDENPQPPANATGLAAVAGEGEVLLTWQKPSGNFKEYSLTYTPNGSLITIPASDQSFTVTGLTNGVSYTFILKTIGLNGLPSSGVEILATPVSSGSDIKTFAGNLQLLSQADVDNVAEEYDFIDGTLTISGTDISDLSVFSSLDSISNKFEIYSTQNLQDLSAFENLKKIGSVLYFKGNLALRNLDGLSNLESIGGDLVILNNDHEEFTNLDGLSALKHIGKSIYIGIEGWKAEPGNDGNDFLKDFCGIKNALSGFTGDYFVEHNAANPSKQDIINGDCEGTISVGPADVTNFKATPDDTKINLTWTKPADADLDGYELTYEPGGTTPIVIPKESENHTVIGLTNDTEYTFTIKAKNISGQFSDGVTVKGTPSVIVYVGNVALLTQADVNAFNQNYKEINGNLFIQGDDITDLAPLGNLEKIIGKLDLLNMPNLASLDGLNLTYVGKNLSIAGNSALLNIDGLSQLTFAGKDIVVFDCDVLPNLNGFSGLLTVKGTFYIGTAAYLDPPVPHPNESLSDFCGLKNLFVNGTHEGNYFAENNAANPTKDDIINNCD